MASLPLENYRNLIDDLGEDDPRAFPTYGIITDAAHGFWKDNGAILIVSIEYSKDILGWVPVYVSYARGQTAEVFADHFYGFFRTIRQRAIEEKVQIRKELFAGVCPRSTHFIPVNKPFQVADFSAAENEGFILAYIRIGSELWPYKTTEELRTEARSLLKGCAQHFKAGVVRVSNISAAVPPSEKHRFRDMGLGLLNATDHEDLIRRAAAITDEFPDTTSFFEWWLMPERAGKLFPPEMRMQERLAQLIPDSTNAVESQHRKIYIALGKNHPLILGLRYLARYLIFHDEIIERAASE
jgi:hypothetical protein